MEKLYRAFIHVVHCGAHPYTPQLRRHVLCPLLGSNLGTRTACTTDPQPQPQGSLQPQTNQLIHAPSSCISTLYYSSTYSRLTSHTAAPCRAHTLCSILLPTAVQLPAVQLWHPGLMATGCPANLPCSAARKSKCRLRFIASKVVTTKIGRAHV